RYGEDMRAGEDLIVMSYLDRKCKGFYCEEILMLYVEDREVNLAKTLDYHRNKRQGIKLLMKNGVLKLPFSVKVLFWSKHYIKSMILNAMRIWPEIYLKTVKYRYLEDFNIGNLETKKIEFINKI